MTTLLSHTTKSITHYNTLTYSNVYQHFKTAHFLKNSSLLQLLNLLIKQSIRFKKKYFINLYEGRIIITALKTKQL